VKLLFVKRALAWPRASGHDVHTFNMMKACARLGHDVELATVVPPLPEAIEGAGVARVICLSPTAVNGNGTVGASTTLQERFRSYWGVEKGIVADLGRRIVASAPDALVVVGLEALPYLTAIPPGVVRVWYAADEWVWHHLSLVQATAPGTWTNIRSAAIKGLYERAYAPLVDRAWVVSASERRAMRWLAGVSEVDVVPNGVDAEYYRPLHEPESPYSAVFWGRLDFEPNIQALQWFCSRIWPAVRAHAPDARFTIIGFKPGEQVRALARLPGVTLKADVPDLRVEASRHALVVLPFVSGGGIKNKLLEAAALGKAIVCTPRATAGLRSPQEAPLVAVSGAADWVRAILDLWADDSRREMTGAAARRWVVARHSWEAAAAEAVRGLSSSVDRRGAA
jgi:polysaccharide biosynthesis protein PslH